MSELLGNKSIGSIVKIKENGTAANYIVVHKGKPSSLYDESCNGVWLLREKALDNRAWDCTSYENDYEASDIHTWLNGEFYSTIENKIREAIVQVKIPYKKGTGSASTPVQTDENGLPCKIFLLSGYEVGVTKSYNPCISKDGAKLSYFSDRTKRIAYDSADFAVDWWLRSADTNFTYHTWFVNTDGELDYNRTYHTEIAPRPALVLPSYLLVDLDEENEESKHKPQKLTIAVDFDGTLCESAFPDIGAPKPLVIDFIKRQQAAGAHIILHTCRENGTKRALLDEALQFCKEQGIELYAINENPDNTYGKEFGVDSKGRKVFADLYIDDKAMNTAQIEIAMQTYLKAGENIDNCSDKP